MASTSGEKEHVMSQKEVKRKYIGATICFILTALFSCFIIEPIIVGMQMYNQKKEGYIWEKDHVISWTTGVILGQCLQIMIGFILL